MESHHNEDSELTALIHPVSTLIISNHFTRCVLQNEGKYVQVVGALLGKQGPRTVEIQNCFEVETELADGKLAINMDYFRAREAMYQETFPNQAFVGFYVTGDHLNVDESDLLLYERASEIGDAVVLLKLNPMASNVNDKLPVSVFESTVDHTTGKSLLSTVNVKVISETAEQIGTDHAAKFTAGGDKNETTASKKLTEQSGALKMLWKGLQLSRDYMKAVDEKKLPADPEILRELHKMAIKFDYLKKQMVESSRGECDLNDKMIVLLTMENKVAGTIFSIISKLNVIITEHNNPSQQTPMKRKENM